jgi:hypothetical protein
MEKIFVEGAPIVIPFGGNVPELSFSLDEWNKAYGPQRSESTKRLEGYYKNLCNLKRIENGFHPIL